MPTYGGGNSNVPSPRRRAWDEFEACWDALMSLGGTREEIERQLEEIAERAERLTETHKAVIINLIKKIKARLASKLGAPEPEVKIAVILIPTDLTDEELQEMYEGAQTLASKTNRDVRDIDYVAGSLESVRGVLDVCGEGKVSEIFLFAHGVSKPREWENPDTGEKVGLLVDSLDYEEDLVPFIVPTFLTEEGVRSYYFYDMVYTGEFVEACEPYLTRYGQIHIIACNQSTTWASRYREKEDVHVYVAPKGHRGSIQPWQGLEYVFEWYDLKYKRPAEYTSGEGPIEFVGMESP